MKFTTIKSEGGLIPFDILEKIYSGDIIGQSARDFGIEGSVLDEISKTWKAARTFYNAFQLRLNRLKPEDSAVRDTREQWIKPLLESLGFPNVTHFAKADEVAGKTYAISHRANENRESLPVHIVSIKDNLDKRSESGRPRLSPHSLMQEFINHTEHLWGIVTNGYSLRLLRDSSKISRPVYIEFDLQQIFEQEKFNEFALFFRLVHYTHLPKHLDDSSDCFIERYYNEAINTGGRVRDKLRDGVEEALKILGNGFINHPDNKWLRDEILQNKVNAIEYYRQLLRLVYRMLFLMVSEERNLVGPTDPKKEPIYYNFYSVNRLRDLSHTFIPGLSKPSDLWESMLVTFKLYSDEGYGERLSISALNGDLFGQYAIPLCEKCKLYNKDFLSAIKQISLYEDNTVKRRINYLALDVEELGSVYESLLDFHPIVQIFSENNIQFQLVFGSERKTTGSYYTNHDLVHELIESALVPVIKRITTKQTSNEQKINELLQLKVCDPAAGSGHFILAAARRIAIEIASLRSGEDYPTPTEFRTAIRDVIQRCIYGVDLNPLAVDLCKLALWLEGHTKGKPLSFLDHRIRNGNSLIGAFSYEQIKKGIPDEAFNPVTGDDKEVAKYFKKRNKEERKGKFELFGPQMSVATEKEIKYLSTTFSQFDYLNIDTTNDYHKAEEEFIKLKESSQWQREWNLANIWTYAFFAPLTNTDDRTVPTQEEFNKFLTPHESKNGQLIGKADAASVKNKFFHWFLEFPDVFAKGGFDCILGNPPWDKIEFQENEWFSIRSKEISNADTAAMRKKLINDLQKSNLHLFNDYKEQLREVDSIRLFLRFSDKYPLCSVGKVNSYAVFAELSKDLINEMGHVGVIVPTGIATDDSTKLFFQHIVNYRSLKSLYSFENEELLFPNVHHATKFCLLTLVGALDKVENIDFLFFARKVDDLLEEDRHFTLNAEEISSINPNTKTCPIFKSKKDAKIATRIYNNFPVLINETITNGNPWNVSFKQGFYNMTSDSSIFHSREELELSGGKLINNYFYIEEEKYYPLYEGKMIWHFDHRFGTYDGQTEAQANQGKLPELCQEEHKNPNFYPIPKYWIHSGDLIVELIDNKKVFLTFRDITSSVVLRTAIFSTIPALPTANNLPIVLFDKNYVSIDLVLLQSNFSSFVFDYITRQTLGGSHMNFYILKQLPVIIKKYYSDFELNFILLHTLELIYTAFDLKPFAQDCGYDGSPFIWDEERRFLIRCELDALFFKLYGLNRDEADYVMETFPIVKRKDIEKYGEYRTKRIILQIFDEMLECERTSKQYQTRLDPPPADPKVAHKEK